MLDDAESLDQDDPCPNCGDTGWLTERNDFCDCESGDREYAADQYAKAGVCPSCGADSTADCCDGDRLDRARDRDTDGIPVEVIDDEQGAA